MTARVSAQVRSQILEKFRDIKTWQSGGQRARHKPLLLLLMLARLSRGESGTVDYRTIDEPMTHLLREFGPSRTSDHPEYPFWYLRNDGIWVVSDADLLERRKGKDTPTKTAFKKNNPTGHLTRDVEAAIRSDYTLLAEIVGELLEEHFPHSLHEDILTEVGMQLDQIVTHRRPRDPAFRERVLRAYECRCAVCGFDVRLGSFALALEAAHIKWHQAGGPDIERNGLALCSLHHKLLDRGAYTLSPERQVLVSQDVCGSEGLEESLLRWHGCKIRAPQSDDYLAANEFIAWHEKQVFKRPARSN